MYHPLYGVSVFSLYANRLASVNGKNFIHKFVTIFPKLFGTQICPLPKRRLDGLLGVFVPEREQTGTKQKTAKPLPDRGYSRFVPICPLKRK